MVQGKRDVFISKNDAIPPPPAKSTDKSVCEELRHLSQSIKMDRNQRFASEEQDDETNTGKKKWKKLEETYKKIILFASTTDRDNPPEEPTDRFISLLSGGTAPIVSRLFRTWHNKTDIIVQPGMATSIGKGVVTSFPSPFNVNTFSPLFTPPAMAGFSDISNSDETKLELSLKSSQGLSEQQKNQLTSTKPFVPNHCHILVRQLENFYLVLGDIFGYASFISTSVKEFINAFKNNDMLVNHSYQNFPFFGVWALNTVHYKVQSFLHACAGATEMTEINFPLYQFQDEIQAILTQQSHLFVKPPWYNPQKRDLDINNPNSSGGGGKQQLVLNPTVDSAIKVANGNVLHSLVTNFVPRGNIAQYRGTEICHKYHLLGRCTIQCHRNATHQVLPQGVQSYYKRRTGIEMVPVTIIIIPIRTGITIDTIVTIVIGQQVRDKLF